ncbi:hypothetical protein N7532_004595 [Penicillium argentinense]|uniref:Transcription factor TFIIIC complex subunit Tfc6 n=1 Tax=Penicillium argentinense TaxID=1131581 RepID=A0A9W9FPN0_9EURO|nr:uncharacterized protein N7532_004595 [Penicillium argentinense]KAJ5104066.1 hypothetical protein N7532_004595 [Penicillium argentinense]
MPSTRRSGRARTSAVTYNSDPFKAAGISDDESDETFEERVKRLKRESPSDEDFVSGDEDMADDGDDDGMEYGTASEGDEERADEDHDEEAAEDRFADEMEIDTPTKQSNKRTRFMRGRTKQRFSDGTMELMPHETHSRGVLDHNVHISKVMHHILALGSDQRDLKAAVWQRDRWFRGIDSCFPSRYTLDRLEEGLDYKYGPTYGVDSEDLQAEKTSGWDWYYDKDIGEQFQKRQQILKLTKNDTNKYFAKLPKGQHTVLMGPADEQTKIDLKYYDPYNYGQLWEGAESRASDQQSKNTAREGWLLSFGRKIMCTAWAPNHDGASQYLAVVVPITEAQKKKFNTPDLESATHFQPRPSYPCAIQLWEFKGKKAGSSTMSLDMESKPIRRLVVCTDWGDIRRISWCPVPREKRPEDEQGNSENIGLLAGVWGDGKVRVLDIKVRRGSRQEEHVKITSPAFEARPPSALCSCVTWLSPSDIAVGCSDGYVAIWSILPTPSPDPLPFFYQVIHPTWVLSIASAYPAHPHLISTIAMDGETKLWSMIDPWSENSSTVRVRVAVSHISYSPVLQAFYSFDENNFMRMMPIRRFFASTSIGKLSSGVASLAPCSPWHPSILVGGTGGGVMATNPFRKLLYSKEQQWQHYWFTHEWAPGPSPESSGASRFFDGYIAESQVLAKNLPASASASKQHTGPSITTIHEEGTHVTALGWNPNRPCAAWASAAMGCGLLRVEDLAI